MSIRIGDGTTDTTVDATSKGLIVQNPKTVAQAGFAAAAAVRDAGSVIGSVTAQPVDATSNARLRVGRDTCIWRDTNNAGQQNTSLWYNSTNTMALANGSGWHTVLNSGSIVTANSSCSLQSWRQFDTTPAGGLRVEFQNEVLNLPETNANSYLGIGTISGSLVPTDGAYFAWVGATFQIVVNANATTISSTITAPTAGVVHNFVIVIMPLNVEFWIDGVLQGILGLPASSDTPIATLGGRLFASLINGAGSPASAPQVRFGGASVYELDVDIAKPAPHQAAGMGKTAFQTQNGTTPGQIVVNMANSGALPAGGAGSNTGALGSGLGGLVQLNAVASGSTDMILTGYNVLATGVSQQPRTLYITGVRISAFNNGAAVAGTPTTYLMAIAFGSTGVSLATTESATTPSKAPRRFPLGFMTWPVGAAIGAMPTNGDIDHTFASPIPVNPGEWINTYVKCVTGTATASQTTVFSIMFEGYWE